MALNKKRFWESKIKGKELGYRFIISAQVFEKKIFNDRLGAKLHSCHKILVRSYILINNFFWVGNQNMLLQGAKRYNTTLRVQ